MPRSERGGRAPAGSSLPGGLDRSLIKGPRSALAGRLSPQSPSKTEPASLFDPADSGKLAVARIGAARGLRGDLKIQSYSGETEHLLSLREAELVGAGRRLRARVMRAEDGPGGLTMAFEGYESPESARELIGLEIIVARKDAAPLEENEFYIADLVGLSLLPPWSGKDSVQAQNPAEAYGKVLAVLSGGPDPWLETELQDGRRALIPFRKEFIGEIDLPGGRAELVAPWILE